MVSQVIFFLIIKIEVTKNIVHRGPDHTDLVVSQDGIYIGHTRLNFDLTEKATNPYAEDM